MNEKQGEYIELNNVKEFIAYFSIPEEVVDMLAEFYQRYYLVEASHIAIQLTDLRKNFFKNPKENVDKVKALLNIQQRAYLFGQIRQQQSRSMQTKSYHDWFNQFYHQPFNRASGFWDTVTHFFSTDKNDKHGFEEIVNQLKAENNGHVFSSKRDIFQKFTLLMSLEEIIIGIVNYVLSSLNKRIRCDDLQMALRVLLWCVEDQRLSGYHSQFATLISNIHFIDQERKTLVSLSIDGLSAKNREPLLTDSRSQLSDYAHRVNRQLMDVPDSDLSVKEYSKLMRLTMQYADHQQIKKWNKINNARSRLRCSFEFETVKNHLDEKVQCVIRSGKKAWHLPGPINEIFLTMIPCYQLAADSIQALSSQIKVADIDNKLEAAKNRIFLLLKLGQEKLNFSTLGWRYVYYYRRIMWYRRLIQREFIAELTDVIFNVSNKALENQDMVLSETYPNLPKDELMTLDHFLRKFECEVNASPEIKSLRVTLNNRLSAKTLFQQIMEWNDQQVNDGKLNEMLKKSLMARRFVPLHYLSIEDLIHAALTDAELNFNSTEKALRQIKSLGLSSLEEQTFIDHLLKLVRFKRGVIPYELYDCADHLGCDIINNKINQEVDLFFDYLIQHPSSMSSTHSLAAKILHELFNGYLDTPQCIQVAFIKKAESLIHSLETEFAVLATLKKLLTPYNALPAINNLQRSIHQSLMTVDVLPTFQLPSESECDAVIPALKKAINDNQIHELSKHAARPIPIRLTYLKLKESRSAHLSDNETKELKRYGSLFEQYGELLKKSNNKINLFSSHFSDNLAILVTTTHLAGYAAEITPLFIQLQNQLAEQVWLWRFSAFFLVKSAKSLNALYDLIHRSAVAMNSEALLRKKWSFQTQYDLHEAVNQLRSILSKRIQYFTKRLGGQFKQLVFFNAQLKSCSLENQHSFLALISEYLGFLKLLIEKHSELKGELDFEWRFYLELKNHLQQQSKLMKHRSLSICARGG